MTAEEYRQMDLAELEVKEGEAREQLFRLRFQLSMGQNDGLKKYRATKKDLARLLQVTAEKKNAAAASE